MTYIWQARHLIWGSACPVREHHWIMIWHESHFLIFNCVILCLCYCTPFNIELLTSSCFSRWQNIQTLIALSSCALEQKQGFNPLFQVTSGGTAMLDDLSWSHDCSWPPLLTKRGAVCALHGVSPESPVPSQSGPTEAIQQHVFVGAFAVGRPGAVCSRGMEAAPDPLY